MPGTPRNGYYGGVDPAQLAAAAARAADSRMSLDQFAATHTSEDNDSFREILERHNAKRGARYAWQQQETHDAWQAKQTLRIEAAEAAVKRRRALAAPGGGDRDGGGAVVAVTDGSGTEDGASAPLVFTKFKAKNELYYPPDGLALSVKETTAMVQGPPKETVAKRARFAAPPAERLGSRRRSSDGALFTPTPGRFDGDEDAAERVARELEAEVVG